MARTLPYFPFYPEDWLSDEKLRACSLAARGLWIDMLSLMHKNDRRGYLQLNAKPLSLEQLSRMTGSSTEEVSRLYAELFNAGVFSVSEDGSIYSRRMTRDEQIRQVRSEAGTKGAAVCHGKTSGKPLANCQQTPGQTSGSGIGSGSESSGKGGAGGKGPDPPGFAEFWEAWPVKENRKPAVRAWRKISPDAALVAVIVAAVQRHKQSDRWRRGIIPHASTWLNEERWNDQPPDQIPNGRIDVKAELAKKGYDV